jgi:hypothetical protein
MAIIASMACLLSTDVIFFIGDAPKPKPEPPKPPEKASFGWPDKAYYDVFPPMPVGGPSSLASKFAVGDLVASATPAAKAKAGDALKSIAFPSYAVPEEMRTSWNALRCLVEGRVADKDDPALSASMGWALADLAEEATKKELAKAKKA